MKVKSFPGQICFFCNKSDINEENPIVKLCNCEKYYHFKCLKKEMRYLEKKENNCIRYIIYTNCLDCDKFIPLTFFVERMNENNKKKEYKSFELLDIPRDKNENYLLLETLDFLDDQNRYIKYIFYIRLRKEEKDKNFETILIGREPKNKSHNKYNIKYDELILVGNNTYISREHSIIIYDAEEKNLILRNVSESQNTLILKNELELKPNDNELLLEFENIQIKSHIIYNEDKQFYETKTKMEKESMIEKRKRREF